MTSSRRPGRARFILVFVVFLGAMAGCQGRPIQSPLPDASSAGSSGGGPGERADGAAAGGAAGTGEGGDAAAGASSSGAPGALGQACVTAGDCASGFCVDGVCCNVACWSGCQTCAVPGSAGTCMNRTDGSTPRKAADCAAATPASCGLDGNCDGAGSCRRWPTGTICGAGTCNGQTVMGQMVCNGSGACLAGGVVNCVPYACDPVLGACRDRCLTDDDCTGGRSCSSGSCSKASTGRCQQNSDCVSGFCVDGVCCNVPCAGPCVSCSLTGREGTCWPVDEGLPDPRGLCLATAPETCGQTGTCDGVGACAKYPKGTLCAPATCSGTTFTPIRACDGAGTCPPAVPLTCLPDCASAASTCDGA